MSVVPSTPPRVPIVPSTPSRAPVVPSTPSRMLVVPTSATSYSDIAKSAVSPKAHGLKIMLKRPSPIPDVLTTTQPPGPMGSEPTKPSTGAGPMQGSQEPTAGSEEVCRSSLTAHLLCYVRVERSARLERGGCDQDVWLYCYVTVGTFARRGLSSTAKCYETSIFISFS